MLKPPTDGRQAQASRWEKPALEASSPWPLPHASPTHWCPLVNSKYVAETRLSARTLQLTDTNPPLRKSAFCVERYVVSAPVSIVGSLAKDVKAGLTMPLPSLAATMPGWTEKTRSSGYSASTYSPSLMTPSLLVEYELKPGMVKEAPRLIMLMIVPLGPKVLIK